MDERLKFVARMLDGEKMAELCREFEISRKLVRKYGGSKSLNPRTPAEEDVRAAVADTR